MENDGTIDSKTNTNQVFEIAELKPYDVVWAEYKGLHWPAFVINVDKKNRSIKVMYMIYTPKKTFEVPYHKIHVFCDDEFAKEAYETAKKVFLGNTHLGVYKRSKYFIMRRTDGFQDNPVAYLDHSRPYFLNSENLVGKLNSEDAFTGRCIPEEECDGEEETQLYEDYHHFSDRQESKILKYIQDGAADCYLIDIWKSKIESERHELYLKAMSMKNVEFLTNYPPYLTVRNHDILKSIKKYLYELYMEVIEKDELKANNYIHYVWLPEAIDEVLSFFELSSSEKIDNLTEEQSKPVIGTQKKNSGSCCSLPKVATTSEISNRHMNEKSRSIVTELNSTQTRSLTRSLKGAPPAMQVPAEVYDLEASNTVSQIHSYTQTELTFNNNLAVADKHSWETDEKIFEAC